MRILNNFYYKNIIKKTFPFKVKTLTKCGEGQDCLALLVNNTYIVKIPKNNLAASKLTNEINLLKFLETKHLNLQVPKLIEVVFTQDNKTPFYTVITKMDGEQLTRKKFDKLPEESKNNIAKDIAQFLNNLHNLNTDKLNIPKEDIQETLYKEYNHIVTNYGRQFTSDQLQKFKKFIDEIVLFYNPQQIKYSVLHGDFSIDVIFYDFISDKVIGIIDFGDSYIGDRDIDFFYLLEGLEDYPLAFGNKVASLYGESNNINVNLINKKIAIEKEYWCIKQIIKGEKLNNSKMIKRYLKELTMLINKS